MKPLTSSLKAFAAVLLVMASGASGEEDLARLIDQSVIAMNAEQWQEAIELSSEAIEKADKSGGQFGALYYRKGISEMKLKRWDDAMSSFETCYRDYPSYQTAAGAGNAFQKLALLKWGEAAVGAENWDLAISRFRKFIEERDKVLDQFPQGSFYINMAVCHYQLGNLIEGTENLEIAIRNKDGFPTPKAGIIAAFQALATAATRAKNEQLLLDFIQKNRGDLDAGAYAMHSYSGVMLTKAGEAMAADMRRAALALYSFVPETDSVVAEIRARLLLKADPVLEDELASLLDLKAKGKTPEVIKLAATAFIHEKNGNLQDALVSYKKLELNFPKSGYREEHLYQLVRVASLIPLADVAAEYAEVFLKDFPESGRVNELRDMMGGLK